MPENLKDTSHFFHKRFVRERIYPVVQDRFVRRAFNSVDRGNFAPNKSDFRIYRNMVITLKEGATMSQPSVLAEMMQLVRPRPSDKALEIGTASGYGAALLCCCTRYVHTIEYDEELAVQAQERLDQYQYKNVTVHIGDGASGLPSEAPFDVMIVTAGCSTISSILIDQLREGGRIVAPLGKDLYHQRLVVGMKYQDMLLAATVKDKKGREKNVSFVPLMSNQPGGFTIELLEHVQKVKIKHLRQLLNEPDLPEEKLLQKFTATIFEWREIPDYIDLDQVLSYAIHLPEYMYDT